MKKLFFTLLFVVSVLFCVTVTASAEEWLWPTPTSRMNTTWITQKYKSSHLALDIGGSHGVDPIYASKSGTVVARFDGCTCRSEGRGGCSDNNRELGNFVIIDHGNGEYSRYCHLYYKDVAKLNSYVKQGDIIGYMGSTGSSTGVHLDFRIYQGGTGIQTYSNGYGAYEQKVIGGTTLNNNPKNVYSDGNIMYVTTPNPGFTDTEAPTISNINVKDISGDSFTVECNLNDNVGVTRVWFVLYAPGGTYEFGESASNGKLSYRFDTSKYGGAGTYSLGFYVYDAKENRAEGRTGEIYTTLPNRPTNLKSEKKVYNSTESINLSWDSVPGATHYWIYMWKDGVELYNTSYGDISNFTSAPTSSGKYTFIVRAGNSVGYGEGVTYDFVVTNQVPERVTNIWTDKFEYLPNDTVTFYWDAVYGAQEYWVYLWKDGSQISMDCVGGNTQYQTSLSGYGTYTLIVRPGNINGFNDASNWCTFEVVQAPLEISCNKNVYNSAESIYFTWNFVDGATNYWVYMWRDGVELYSMDMGNSNTFTSAPTSSGNYALIVRAINNNSSYADAIINFTVTNNIPGAVVDVKSDKKVYKTGEEITFTWSTVDLATDYWVSIYNGNTKIYNSSIGNRTTFSTPLAYEGNYAFCVNSGNSNGYSEATILRFTITDEPITVSKIIKSNNSFTINTTVYNFTSPYEIFVAGYNGNKLVSLSPSVNGVATLSGDIDTVKVMAWDSLSGLTSLCEAEAIPQSEFIME